MMRWPEEVRELVRLPAFDWTWPELGGHATSEEPPSGSCEAQGCPMRREERRL